jgi:hypothetical protein
MSVIEDLKTVENRVKVILIKYPETRNNDKKLWLAYNLLHNDLKPVVKTGDWETFRVWIMSKKTPMFESLSRARRKIQEDHPVLAGAKKKRLKIAEEVKEWSRT